MSVTRRQLAVAVVVVASVTAGCASGQSATSRQDGNFYRQYYRQTGIRLGPHGLPSAYNVRLAKANCDPNVVGSVRDGYLSALAVIVGAAGTAPMRTRQEAYFIVDAVQAYCPQYAGK